MAKNGHRKERRSVTHLLAMDKRRRKAKGPIRQITAEEMQKNYEDLTTQFNELSRLWKVYKIYFDILGQIDTSYKDNEEFTTNNQICIDEDSKVDASITALKSKSFNTETKDDMATFESTIGVFDVLQESVLIISDTYTKLQDINKYCKNLYPNHRDEILKANKVFCSVFDKVFDYKSEDGITVDIDMSKEVEETPTRSLGFRPTELTSSPKELNYVVTSHAEHEDKVISNSTIPSIEEVSNNELDTMHIDPEAFKNVDKSEVINNDYLEIISPNNMNTTVTEKENNNGEIGEESKED